jgi:hypothetical protein
MRGSELAVEQLRDSWRAECIVGFFSAGAGTGALGYGGALRCRYPGWLGAGAALEGELRISLMDRGYDARGTMGTNTQGSRLQGLDFFSRKFTE